MKKIILLCLNLVAVAGYAQFSGTGPIYTDDLVGLGFTSTTGISGQLHVKTTGSLPIRIERYVSFGHTQNNTFDTYFTGNPVNFSGSVAAGSTIFQSGNHNADMLFLHGNTSNNVKIGLFLKANGYVGIGNVVANERLDVSGNIRINENKILFRGANDVYHGIGYNALSYSVSGPVLFGLNGGLLASNNNGTPVPALRWDNSGNVTIGSATAATGSRFTVTGSSSGTDNMINVLDNSGVTNFRVKANGFVYARDITVQVATFPDYVFDTTYTLMPLHTLDNYINTNHHLPGIPSAATVQQEGMSLGEMNVLLVQKVEELTLYMIQMQKEIDALKQEQK